MVHIVLFLHSNNTATLPSNITGNLSYFDVRTGSSVFHRWQQYWGPTMTSI